MKQGTLYLVATPIGNLDDITFRAIKVLKEVDIIAAEDTRHTIKLLNHYEIKKKLISYYQHNEEQRSDELLEKIKNGLNIALVSDAGIPGISDPGNLLVRVAVDNNIKVIPIPGASAVITALAASGLDTSQFLFKGFLPRKKSVSKMVLEELQDYDGTIVFYESPHRIIKTLELICEILGNREVVLARELTKIHEEFIRGKLEQIIDSLKNTKVIGEFTIVIEGTAKNSKIQQNSTIVELEVLFDCINMNSTSLKEELKNIAKKTGKSSKEIYRDYLKYKERKKV